MNQTATTLFLSTKSFVLITFFHLVLEGWVGDVVNHRLESDIEEVDFTHLMRVAVQGSKQSFIIYFK